MLWLYKSLPLSTIWLRNTFLCLENLQNVAFTLTSNASHQLFQSNHNYLIVLSSQFSPSMWNISSIVPLPWFIYFILPCPPLYLSTGSSQPYQVLAVIWSVWQSNPCMLFLYFGSAVQIEIIRFVITTFHIGWTTVSTLQGVNEKNAAPSHRESS